jgi:hypothetical protein
VTRCSRLASPRVFVLAVALVTALAALAVGRPASAELEPSRAQADVDAAMHDKGYPFCREPRLPLSETARALCADAAATPGCEGFARACETPKSRSFQDFVERVGRFLGRHTPEFVKPLLRALAGLPRLVFGLVVVLLLAAVLSPALLAILRARRGRPREPRPESAPAPVEALVTGSADEGALLRLADEHAREGRAGTALQLYLAASLRALDRRGAIRLGKDRTNGEYVRSCSEDGARPALREIAGEVDRVQFGRVPPPPDRVARAAQLAAQIVSKLTICLFVLVLPAVAGCGWQPQRAGDDPAGDELLYDVLRAQGARVGPLDGSLAALSIPPDPGASTVVVDVSRTPLEDDVRAHLAAWVRAGGALVLVGDPEEWPADLGAAPVATSSRAFTVRPTADDAASHEAWHGEVADGEALVFAHSVDAGAGTPPSLGEPVATFDDGTTYAVALPFGDGWVLGVATDELLTNAGLARPGNATALMGILEGFTDKLTVSDQDQATPSFQIAEVDDGAAPPPSPFAAMVRVGLGAALLHALAATLVLFVAVGVRLARPRPAPPPRRRAFSEHVEAVGALYARTRSASHALAAYVRFAEVRLRARMPRGSTDVASFLATRSRRPLDACQRLWNRATAPQVAEPKNQRTDDDLVILRDLSAACAAALAEDE